MALGSDFPMGSYWAAQLLGTVLPTSAIKNADLRHREAISALMTRAFMMRSADLGMIITRTRCAYDVLDLAFDKDARRTAESVDAAFARMDELQQREFSLTRSAEKNHRDDLEAKFRGYLDLYVFTYEDFYRTLAAPYAEAFACIEGANPVHLDPDGRVNVGALDVVENKIGLEAGILTEGKERHLRNSAAHHRYSVLDDDRIRLWDMDQKGVNTWGPVEWTHWELRQQVYRFANTCSVLLLGMVAFDITNARQIVANGWRNRAAKARRRDIVHSELLAMADLHGFSVKSVRPGDGNELLIDLAVLGDTVLEQDTMIVGVNGPRSRSYRQAIRTEWGPLRTQVYGFLQMTLEAHDGYGTVRVSVTAQDGKTSHGYLVADLESRKQMLRGEAPDRVKASLRADTLEDVKIPVVIRGAVRSA